MAKDEQLIPESLKALQKHYQEQSRKAQAYYTVMHEMREIAGNDDAASAWMNQPLEAFKGKTPSELVGDNRTEDLLDYIKTLKR